MRTSKLAAMIFLLAGVGAAQQRNGGTTGGAPTGTAPNTGSTNTRTPSITTPPGNNVPDQRPIFISGKVALSDGTAPSEPVKIERVCNGTARVEARTDRKGRFSFQLGQNLEFQDASSNGQDGFGIGGGGFGGQRGPGFGSSSSVRERDLFGCELRASLPGYRSDSVTLANIHYMDNPDIGTIILHPIAKVDGLTVSATTALAPKDARKAYEKGLEAAGKKNPDEAQKNFEKAVALYPKYAAAWFALGQINEQREHAEEARKAYEQSIASDSKFVPPYERLSFMALKESKWQDLADTTNRMLQLNPYDYPSAYYLSGVANLQLQHLDVAEKNAREAIRLDPLKKNARAHYVLGLILAQKQEFTTSAASLHTFLDADPNAPDVDFVRKQLEQVEAAAKEKGPPAQQ
jgi:tetratricopeptide (TPR) repeat protein